MDLNLKLYMLLLGCKPAARLTEQHDVFFGIAPGLPDLLPAIKQSWPEAKGVLHIDAWRSVVKINGFIINIVQRDAQKDSSEGPERLFFINLGGYKKEEFEEYHYKILVVANDKSEAIRQSKQTAFFRHTGFTGANSHIDDKYGIDVDDVYNIEDCLPATMKQQWRIQILHNTKDELKKEDEMHLGYLKISDILKSRG